jgi:hypothetical protein
MEIIVIGPLYFPSLYQIKPLPQASVCFSLNYLHYSVRFFNSLSVITGMFLAEFSNLLCHL